MRWSGLRVLVLTTAVVTFSGAATSAGAQSGVREVSATDRGVIPLQTRLRYTTMVILPDGEEILDVLCGDRDWWVISATHNIAHVKPAKAGAETNLNLVTSSGTIYSFMLTEKSSPPDLKVYVQGDPTAAGEKPKYYSAAQVEALETQIAELRESLRDGERKTDEAIAAYRQQYPTRLQFPYGSPKYEKPFLIRSMWHDGQFTYMKSDATELPALYEVKDGKPAIVNFQVREGTYIVPKVLDRGYLALGTSDSRSSCRGDSDGRTVGNSRYAACQRPSPGPTGRAASRFPDLADGWSRARHRSDHPHRGPARAAGNSSAIGARPIGAEPGPSA